MKKSLFIRLWIWAVSTGILTWIYNTFRVLVGNRMSMSQMQGGSAGYILVNSYKYLGLLYVVVEVGITFVLFRKILKRYFEKRREDK